ncbi:MAG TPA: tetratricopeptide repeat protein [Crinalium sp.]
MRFRLCDRPLPRHKQWIFISVATVYVWLGGFVSLPWFSIALPALARPAPSPNSAAEANQLFRDANRLIDVGQYRDAVDRLQQALAIARTVGIRRAEAAILNSLGQAYNGLGEYIQALEVYQQSLPITREISDRAAEGTVLTNIAQIYDHLGQYSRSLDIYQQALALANQTGDRTGVGTTLGNLGVTYDNLGRYSDALDVYQQALAIHRELGNRAEEGVTLNNIGAVYRRLGQYPQALDYYQQSVAINHQLGNRPRVSGGLNNIGQVYIYLGQYDKALELFQQALAVSRELGDRRAEGVILNNMGLAYSETDPKKALDAFQQSLVIRRELGDRAGEGTVLNNIGTAYNDLAQYSQALELFQQSLAIRRQVGNRAEEGATLGNIGKTYDLLGQYANATNFYQQSLVILKEVGDRSGEIAILGNLGNSLAQQNQPELAIVFYKRAINLTEALRQEFQVLPQDLQQSYTERISYIYRRLADLLLKQDRVLEAQQILDLLKVQELEDYLRDIRGNTETAKGVIYLSDEQAILDYYDQHQNQDFRAFLNSSEITARVQNLKRTASSQSLNPEQLVKLQGNLRQLDQPAALLYPLVLDDRLELVLVLPDRPPIRRTVPVKREQLNEAIAQFRDSLFARTRSSTTSAQQLYDWLIRPVEAELTQARVSTIIYAADGQLRYLPLAALYDGNQWLIQRFRVNNITAASLTTFGTQHTDRLRVLAGAFTEGVYSFKVGDLDFSFSGLPYAGQEVSNIAAEVPDTTELLNQQFSPAIAIPQMNRYNIVHLATHAEFVSGQPENSFILFGNGDRVTLRDVATWRLPNVDLVVLSACKTAVSALSNGEEILGFGYQVQRTGARAAIASLWSINDDGTQMLMTAFYAALRRGNVTKAEALRQAQIALITGDYSALGLQPDVMPDQPTRYSRPYYWAPFILLGNGL